MSSIDNNVSKVFMSRAWFGANELVSLCMQCTLYTEWSAFGLCFHRRNYNYLFFFNYISIEQCEQLFDAKWKKKLVLTPILETIIKKKYLTSLRIFIFFFNVHWCWCYLIDSVSLSHIYSTYGCIRRKNVYTVAN